jgi:hypothetical protein
MMMAVMETMPMMEAVMRASKVPMAVSSEHRCASHRARQRCQQYRRIDNFHNASSLRGLGLVTW